MKHTLTKTLAVLAAAGTLGTLALTSANAEARTHFGVGVYLGGPVIAAPWAYSPYYGYPYGGYGGYPYPYAAPYPYYSPAPVVVQQQPSVYVEQNPAPAAAAPPPGPVTQSAPADQYWYYCRDSQTYYPHVQSCASAWQRVVPHAPQ